MSILEKLLRSPVTVSNIIADRHFWPGWLRWKGVRYEEGLLLTGKPVVRITEGGEIRLGKSVALRSRPQSNPLHLNSPCVLYLMKPGARIIIGDDCGLSGTVICAATSVEIGRRVMIGANCRIVDTDFHPLSPVERQRHPTEKAASRPIVIGDDVFIGMQAILLKGTVLGEGCVVGAGAVVSGTFPAFTIVAGNPAKVVKELDPSEVGAYRADLERVQVDSRGL